MDSHEDQNGCKQLALFPSTVEGEGPECMTCGQPIEGEIHMNRYGTCHLRCVAVAPIDV